MATARSVSISVNVASGATPSASAWLSCSQRARPLFRKRTVSATRPTASGSGSELRCATMSSNSSDRAVSARCSDWSASSISLTRAQYDGSQRSISASSG
jgi:hypothetical protein